LTGAGETSRCLAVMHLPCRILGLCIYFGSICSFLDYLFILEYLFVEFEIDSWISKLSTDLFTDLILHLLVFWCSCSFVRSSIRLSVDHLFACLFAAWLGGWLRWWVLARSVARFVRHFGSWSKETESQKLTISCWQSPAKVNSLHGGQEARRSSP